MVSLGAAAAPGGPRRPSKPRIVPVEGFRLQPLRLARLARVFDDDAHAVPAIVIGEITEHPDPGVLHLDDRRDAFGRTEPHGRGVCDGGLVFFAALAFKMWNRTRSPRLTRIGSPWPSILPLIANNS